MNSRRNMRHDDHEDLVQHLELSRAKPIIETLKPMAKKESNHIAHLLGFATQLFRTSSINFSQFDQVGRLGQIDLPQVIRQLDPLSRRGSVGSTQSTGA